MFVFYCFNADYDIQKRTGKGRRNINTHTRAEFSHNPGYFVSRTGHTEGRQPVKKKKKTPGFEEKKFS